MAWSIVVANSSKVSKVKGPPINSPPAVSNLSIIENMLSNTRFSINGMRSINKLVNCSFNRSFCEIILDIINTLWNQSVYSFIKDTYQLINF